MDPRVPGTMINIPILKNGSNEQAEEHPKPKHHGGSFGNYMAYKNQKLHEQFNANAAVTRQSNIFQGVGIYVNGWTSPSHSELKQLMATHGGRFENYYSRSTVTHIICTNLPDAKVKQFEKERSPTPVVRPEWIVRSIEAGKLLPITEYILWQLRGGPGQRTLQDAFAPAGAVQGPEPTPHGTPQADADAGPSTSTHIIPFKNKNTKSHYDPAELAAAQEVAAKMRAECDNLKGPPRSSKDDPNFVESFYRASRLHFIGTWKARLEALMASSLATEAPAPAPYTLGGLGGGGGGGYGKRVILHLDMDCFFASVAEAGHPEFKGKPLAVCHSNSARGSGEVSSANYEARKHGIGASMFISRAKELCPGIIVVPYEFDKYELVSEKVYRILLKYTQAVQPVSCDEAFLDITGLGDPETIAASIRNDIFKATQCTASAGIGPNILLARIATRKAKPNGVFNLLTNCCDRNAGGGGGGTTAVATAAAVLPFLAELSVEDLPGVGWSTKRKLEELGITTIADIHSSSKSTLQSQLGANAGALLWDFAHGKDSRRVEGPKPRRSVGAEVNWGVRFETPEDPEKFVASLAMEVAVRMQQGGVRGRTITLKLKRKKPGWTEPVKYLGMGSCDSFSKSVTLASMTAAAEDLEKEGKVLLRMLRVPFDEIRGMGLAVSRLDTGGSSGKGVFGGSGGGAIEAAGMSGAAGAVPTAARATAEDGVAALEGSEASDAGWELDSESDVRSHKQQQQQPGASPAPSPSGRGMKRKSPVGGKQASLLDMMPPPPPRIARLQDQEDIYEEEEEQQQQQGNERVLQPSARLELLAKYQGLSLTQIDADELAALPYELQRELVLRLPRSRQISTGDNTNLNTISSTGDDVSRTKSLPAAAAAVPAAQEASVSNKPIEPLPAFSQIDRSVLDALPLQLRRELETAYGMKRAIKNVLDTTTAASASGHGRHQYHSPPKRAAGSSKTAHHDSKLRRLDAFVKPKNGPVPAPIFPPSRHQNCGTTRLSSLDITLSQIDPGVLHELPHEIQDEVLRQLQPFPLKKFKAAAAGGGARKALVEARTAAAEASRQRQQLEDLQAAQIEGPSLDREEENVEKILQDLGDRVELPPAVEYLVQLANTDASVSAAPGGVTITQVLEAFSAAIEEINESDIPIRCQTSQSTPESNALQLRLLEVVMGTLSRLGKNFISHDLEGTKKLLMSIRRIGETYPSFTNDANAVIEKLQHRVQRRYGWPLSMSAIL
jgi:DNA repair protein REV1